MIPVQFVDSHFRLSRSKQEFCVDKNAHAANHIKGCSCEKLESYVNILYPGNGYFLDLRGEAEVITQTIQHTAVYSI
jgi:hypothetical protein